MFVLFLRGFEYAGASSRSAKDTRMILCEHEVCRGKESLRDKGTKNCDKSERLLVVHRRSRAHIDLRREILARQNHSSYKRPDAPGACSCSECVLAFDLSYPSTLSAPSATEFTMKAFFCLQNCKDALWVSLIRPAGNNNPNNPDLAAKYSGESRRTPCDSYRPFSQFGV